MIHNNHYLDRKSVPFFTDVLYRHFQSMPLGREIVIVCVGTNRCSGDALGPMVGSRLMERFEDHRYIRIYGTLDKPVHALNLSKTIQHIEAHHPHAYVIAVDACLGQLFKIGTIQLVEAPLVPGVSLNKKLPEVGHIHFKGIINNHSELNHKVLEHTSLTFVRDMAAVISRIIVKASQDIIPALQKIETEDQLHSGKWSSSS